jgi:hypothetical protein
MKKNAESLIGASKDAFLEVNTEKTKYMSAVSLPECRENRGIQIGYRCFQNVAQFRYL